MKKIVLAPAAELSISALKADGLRRVQVWFDYLARYDEDEEVRTNSLPLPGHEGVYLLRTTTEIRMFFRIGDTITVLDVANLAAILASGGVNLGVAVPVRRRTR